MKRLRSKLVPFSLTLMVCLLLFLGVVLSEPVESNAPAAPNADAEASRVIYDQRQTGKYNIHVSIKDVALIEMDRNGIEDVAYSDDDYYYDEGQLTVKPILLNPTTALNQPNVSSTTIATSTHSLNENSSTLSTPNIATTIPNNQTYSPNLLADIAATHATDNHNSPSLLNSTSSSSLILPEVSKKRTQNVVILDTQSLTHNSPSSTHKPAMSTTTTMQSQETDARSKDIPFQSIIQETTQHVRRPPNVHKLPPRPFFRFADTTNMNEAATDNQHNEQENDSKIYKFKVRRAQKQAPPALKTPIVAVPYPHPFLQKTTARRCRAQQYRDASGDCRAKRSSSILKKLFSMLVTLPFPNERAVDDRDNE